MDDGVNPREVMSRLDTVVYVVPPLRAVYMLTDVDPLGRATAHISIQDRSLYRRLDLARQALDIFFRQFNIHRITGYTPITRPLAIRFAQSIGFTVEGRMRQAACYNGRWYDVVITSLLRDQGASEHPHRKVATSGTTG